MTNTSSIESIIAEFKDDSEPKDIKRSVRDKYKRRLQWLAHAVDQYKIAANDRIEHGGNIRDKKEIKALLAALESLEKLLPEERGLDEETNRRLCEIFNIEYVPLDKRL